MRQGKVRDHWIVCLGAGSALLILVGSAFVVDEIVAFAQKFW